MEEEICLMPKSPTLVDPVKKAPPAPLKAQNPADSGNPKKGGRMSGGPKMKPPRGAGRNPFLEAVKPGGKL